MLNNKAIVSLVILLCLPLLAVRGHDVRFATGRSALCIPIEGDIRQVAFKRGVNDRSGMRVVLDTGAEDSVLNAGVADALGLEQVGIHHALGAGGPEQGSTVRGVNVGLPGFELLDQTMGTLHLDPISASAGRPIDVILGQPVFKRCVVEVDYPRKCASFFDAESYEYRGSGVAVPLSFDLGLPHVEARIVLPDGRSLAGKFVIDTGAATNVILSPDVIESNGVIASLGKTIASKGRGVGGARDMRLGRVAKLELGGFTLSQPVISLRTAGPGAIAGEGTVGNIGGGVLSRFKVTFDYPRRRMYLEPGPDVARPFEADMSGLVLTTVLPDLKRMKVLMVLVDSPALEAGLQAGDEIESVDGIPAGDIGLTALRERLRLEGQNVKLAVVRGAERIATTLRTRRLI
jgi:predicted aspartyl protease